jgi:hypothetical protein
LKLQDEKRLMINIGSTSPAKHSLIASEITENQTSPPQEERQESKAQLMTLIEDHMLPALHTGPAHHTLLNIVSWCSALDNLNVSAAVRSRVLTRDIDRPICCQ